MTVMIQIRHVPEEIHRTLKERAAREGKSLSDYLLDQLHHIAARPTMAEMIERLKTRKPVDPGISMEDAVRAERDSR